VGGEGGLLDVERLEGGVVAGARFDVASGAALGPVDVDLGFPSGQVVLAPGERADVVLVTDGAVGAEWPLLWEDVARGRHDMWMEGDEMVMGDAEDDGTRPGVEVARFRLRDGAATGFAIAEGDPLLTSVGLAVGQVDVTAATDRFDADGSSLDELMSMELDEQGSWLMSVWFGINGESWHPTHEEGPEQIEAPSAKYAHLGETLRWEVRNNSMMAHPYHLHGFSYQPYEMVLWPDPEDTSSDGTAVRVAWPHDEFEDTTVMPPFSSLYFRLVLADPAGDGSALGRWMEHCHILQHGENGMMSELVVEP
jgi:FtsP/CotA-like multicopper oxidase with cupredoxin domain